MPGDILDTPMGRMMLARHDMTENLYKKMEEHLPFEEHSEEMRQHMNRSMGFPVEGERSKPLDYRPYCVREGCKDMPRMMKTSDGFMCWSCHGKWDIRKQMEEAGEG